MSDEILQSSRSSCLSAVVSRTKLKRDGESGDFVPLEEIAASLYAWDLADEGIDRCLANLESRAGCNSIYLVGLMHEEKRPLHAQFYPHNPVRKYYTPEDSRAYWRPDPARYDRIKPLTSDRESLKSTDWLTTLVEAARKHEMRTGCELSHTIIDAKRLGEEYNDIVQRNVYGEPVSRSRGTTRRVYPCLNNEDLRIYLISLFVDLALNYDIDYIQTCLVLFASAENSVPSQEWRRLIDVATGGCFCSSCEARAHNVGLDWDAVKRETVELASIVRGDSLEALHEGQVIADSNITATAIMLEKPHFAAWLKFRVDSVTEVFRLIHEELAQLPRKVEFRYNTFMAYPELAGLDFFSAFQWVDSVRESDYSDQLGTLEGIELKRQRLLKARRGLGYDKPLIAALGVRPKATSEILRASVRIAVDTGCDGLSLGHYDGATMQRLEAVRAGVIEAEAVESLWMPPDGGP